MSENRAGLVVERATVILTQIPLILPIAAVSDPRGALALFDFQPQRWPSTIYFARA